MKASRKLIYGLLIAVFFIGFSSCDKEKMQPIISFAIEPGYLANDTILEVGDTIKVMLDITWNGKHRVTGVELMVNDKIAGEYPIDMDTGQFSITLIKGLPETEVWDFTITDAGNNSSTITLILSKDPNSKYSGLKYFDSISLGAQSHVNKQGFMSLEHSTYYNLDGAFANQEKIDLIFYCDDIEGATIASPGANIGEDVFSAGKAPSEWTIQNTSKFQKVEMLPEVFFGLFHDGYILDNYNEDEAKPKAKELADGDIYLFQTEGGKKGILYINSIVNGADGEVNFALKIQE